MVYEHKGGGRGRREEGRGLGTKVVAPQSYLRPHHQNLYINYKERINKNNNLPYTARPN